MKIFLISPVRSITDTERIEISDYAFSLVDRRNEVYVPAIHTDQDDESGLRICSDNLEAMQNADEIHVWWNESSVGSIFDLGMAFALGKPIKIANMDALGERTKTKSFRNVLEDMAARR